MHTERPEGPALSGQRPPVPARAASAQVKLANPVHSVRRADRGPVPITCLVHLLPPAGPAPGPAAQPTALYFLLTTSHLLPWPGRLSGHWHHRPWSGPTRPAPVTVVAPGRHAPAAGSSSSRGRACYAGASSQSPSIQSGHIPCPIQAGPLARHSSLEMEGG